MAELVRTRLMALVCVVVMLVASCSSLMAGRTETKFQGFASEEQLLDAFLGALAANDREALDRLRVTQSEYRDVIIPGSVPVGKSMGGPLTDTKFDYFWSMLNTRSRDFATVILHDFGGSDWRRTRYWYTKEPKQLTGYRALGQVRIDVVDPAGAQGTVRAGWIADVAGQYKFIGFQYKD